MIGAIADWRVPSDHGRFPVRTPDTRIGTEGAGRRRPDAYAVARSSIWRKTGRPKDAPECHPGSSACPGTDAMTVEARRDLTDVMAHGLSQDQPARDPLRTERAPLAQMARSESIFAGGLFVTPTGTIMVRRQTVAPIFEAADLTADPAEREGAFTAGPLFEVVTPLASAGKARAFWLIWRGVDTSAVPAGKLGSAT